MQDFFGHFRETNIYPYKNRKYSGLAYAKKAAILILTIFVVAVFYFGFNVYSGASAAKRNFELARGAIIKADFAAAGDYIGRSEINFRKSGAALEKFKPLAYIPKIKNDYAAAQQLLAVGEEASLAISGALNFFRGILPNGAAGDLGLSSLSLEQKEEILAKISGSGAKIEDIKNHLGAAAGIYKKISPGGFFNLRNLSERYAADFLKFEREARALLSLAEIFPQLVGYPEPRTYLFLLQNNTELRPSGGFIGTYGIVKLADGEVKSFFTSDVYALDKQSIGWRKIEPPAPLKKYLGVDYWYMRDANWSPDFTVSAKMVEDFYRGEGGTEVIDGVIAITPDAVADILRIVGPIKAEDQEFTADNLTDALEYRVEIGFAAKGVPHAQRKEVIGVLAADILEKIHAFPLSGWGAIISSITDNLLEKHILFTMKDETAARVFDAEGWSGKIKDTTSDYLLVVDANLNALKSDPEVARKASYGINPSDGKYVAELRLNYKHSGKSDWKTGRYRDYVRVFAPLGSKLISVSQNGEKSERTKDAEIGEDLGKTFFGIFVTVEIGAERELIFRYELPERIKYQIEQNLYTLLAQKQAGTFANGLTLNLNFDKRISESSPAGTIDANGQTYKLETDLRVDRMITIGF
jgi:hypothetical protein